jgi:DNA-binding MarR family transcriptional regulator
MAIEFSNGFFVFDKSWIHGNKFFQSLSHAEFRIMVYLLSSALKISKRDERYKRGEIIASLYQKSGILCANVSQSTIAERCNVDRATAYRALKKFSEIGAIIKMSDGQEKGSNNLYILGFQNQRPNKSGKQEYYLVDSIPIRGGEKLPDKIRKFILEHHTWELFGSSSLIWKDLFGM